MRRQASNSGASAKRLINLSVVTTAKLFNGIIPLWQPLVRHCAVVLLWADLRHASLRDNGDTGEYHVETANSQSGSLPETTAVSTVAVARRGRRATQLARVDTEDYASPILTHPDVRSPPPAVLQL